MSKNPWEIGNIEFNNDNKAEIIQKFIIYDDSKLIQSRHFKTKAVDDFIKAIANSKIDTGIMTSNLRINNKIIYLFILDDSIFIIEQTSLPKFQEYFNEHLNLLIFKTEECKKYFSKALYSNFRNSEENDQNHNEQKYINKIIKNEIIGSIIKKSQYRTIKMRQELLPNKFNSKNDDYKLPRFLLDVAE